MLKPAICYKAELENALKEYFYTKDMYYYIGDWTCSLLEIHDSFEGVYQWAIVSEHKHEVIGYITYSIDFYSSNVYRFGLFSFDRGNPNIGRDVFNLLEELVNKYHRLEFKVMSKNPAIKGYDAFLNKHSDIGKKMVFKDIVKDADGKYHDEYVYEFVNNKN